MFVLLSHQLHFYQLQDVQHTSASHIWLYIPPTMFSASVTAILRTLLLATPVFSANATDWSTRSIYQVTRQRLQACARLMECRSLSQTGLPPLMTRRCLATPVSASIAVARGRELRITSTISKAWDSMQCGSHRSLPISRVRLLRAKHFMGTYGVHQCQRVGS